MALFTPPYVRLNMLRLPCLRGPLCCRSLSCSTRVSRFDQHNYNLKRRQLIHHIQNNPNMIGQTANFQSRSLNWKTVLFLIASSSSVTMAIYLGVEIYKASSDPDDAKPRNVFLPLWFSFDWPYQRRYAFPTYLKYIDMPYFLEVESSPSFENTLQEKSIQYQVLDGLFRSAVVRDLFGIPLSLKSQENDTFNIWIEPKYPTVHGPQVRFEKQDGKLQISWQWTIKSLHWSAIDTFLTGMGKKLDRMENSDASAKTHERGSGRVHEVVLPMDRKLRLDVCGDKDYKVVFQGTFHVSHLSEKPCGLVGYTGVIDFNHLGICQGARIVKLDMVVEGEEGETLYILT